MALEDLKRMVETAEEAEKLLKRKSYVEAEIARAEKRLGKLGDELEAKEKAIEQADSQYKDISSRFEHEKRRYANDLEQHRLQCEDAKREMSKAVQEARKQSQSDLSQLSDVHTKEKARIERETAETRGILDTVRLEISDLKRRVAALG